MSLLDMRLEDFFLDYKNISIVGAGGKTSLLFYLAEKLHQKGKKVAITTTTHIFDPRKEENRFFDKVVFQDEYLGLKNYEKPIVFASKLIKETGKLKSVDFPFIKKIKNDFDHVLIEADGAKKKTIKAPEVFEPVIYDKTDAVVGVIGLDSLNKQNMEENVFRAEIFEKITNCGLSQKIKLEHLISLINSENGLFKGAPRKAKKILLLNKFDLLNKQEQIMVKNNINQKIKNIDLVLINSFRDKKTCKIS